MRWQPITPENAVAKLSTASEHAICDFKARYDFKSDPTKSFEIAKDICAFANHLGGTIIVGAQEGKGERRGLIDTLIPLATPTAGELVKEADRVIRAFCLPVPIANAVTIELSEKDVTEVLHRASPAITIVAINVEPTLNGPIGCLACVEHSKACTDAGTVCRCTGTRVPDAWRFPIRAIEGTDLLRPDQIARRMNIQERRALLELNAIENENVTVWFNPGGTRNGPRPCQIEKLDPERMVCVLGDRAPGGSGVTDTKSAEIPLIFVRAVWKSSEGWNVAIDGLAFDFVGGKRVGYVPLYGWRSS